MLTGKLNFLWPEFSVAYSADPDEAFKCIDLISSRLFFGFYSLVFLVVSILLGLSSSFVNHLDLSNKFG
jgi:hypothetical protein